MCFFRSEPWGKGSTRPVTRQGKKRQKPDNIKTLLRRKYLLCEYLHLNLLSKVLIVTLVVVGVVGGKADKAKSWRSVTAPTTTRRSSLFVCLEIFDEPVCLSQDLFNQWSGQPLPNVFFSLWIETLQKFWMNILYNNFFTFLFYIDCFPFYPWCEGVGDCNREWWYWWEVESSAGGKRRREWRGKNSCLSLSPFSPPQLLCTRLPRALFIIWIVPNILEVDHFR